MIFRGYTYVLRPTPDQERLMEQTAGVCRLVWNLALEQRRDHWRAYKAQTNDVITYTSQARELTSLRREFDFVRAAHVTALQRTLKGLDRAFRNFWRGSGGYPSFKVKGRNDAFSFVGREAAVAKVNRRWAKTYIPKIGWVKYRNTREMKGEIREVTIAKTSSGWAISFGCLHDGPELSSSGSVGIDRGVAVPLMLSDGTEYLLPNGLVAAERRVRQAQRLLSRAKRGSRRRESSLRMVRAAQAKKARIRKDWAHKATSDIAARYGTIVIEALKTKQMTASAKAGGGAQKRSINRAILNVGWHQIEAMLSYKAHRLIKVDPAYSSQTCSSCGAVDRESRKSQASFHCTSCGFQDNADRNAAAVILLRGSTPGVEASGCRAVEAHTAEAA